MEFNKKHFHLEKIILNKIFCFNNLEVKFNKINIIFANNGYGKTYLLRCLDLIGNKVDNNSQAFRMGLYAILSQILNIEEYIKNDITLATKFLGYNFENQKDCSITADIKNSLPDLKDTNIDIAINYDDIINLLQSYNEKNSQSITDLRLKNRQQFVDYIRAEELWKDTTRKMNQDLNNNIDLRDNFLLESIKIFQPRTRAISAGPDGLNIFFDDLTKPLPIGTQGYGLKRFINCLFMIADNHNRFFAIDNAESGLHFNQYFDNANSLINGAKKFNTQLFITTHCREYAIALAEAIKEADMQLETSFFNIARKLGSYENLMLEVNRYDDLDSILHGLQSFQDLFRMV